MRYVLGWLCEASGRRLQVDHAAGGGYYVSLHPGDIRVYGKTIGTVFARAIVALAKSSKGGAK